MKVNNYPLKTPVAGDKLFGSDASGDQHQFDMSNFITYVNSVTGLDTDNTDPLNPVVQIAVDGVTITGDGTVGNPLIATEQYLWSTFEGDTGGPIVAGSPIDALTVAGANGITTNTTSTTLTITSPVNRDDSSVTAQAITAGVPVNLTHTLGQKYVSITVIDTVTESDVTGAFTITFTASGTYDIESPSFTGNVRVLAIG
jgi:hypothetical protein